MPPGADTFQTVLSGKRPKAPSVKPSWGTTASGCSVPNAPLPVNPWGPNTAEIRDFRSEPAPAVQPVDSATFPSLQGPDRFIDDDKPATEHKPDIEPMGSHPVVSQKKAKKYEREARRKAKKIMGEPMIATIPQDHEGPRPEPVFASDNKVEMDADDQYEPSSIVAAKGITIESVKDTVILETKTQLAPLPTAVIALSQPAPVPVTTHDKHTNWANFKREFIIDQLAAPILATNLDHVHPTLCVCETHDLLDCPFHDPCKWPLRHGSCIALILPQDCVTCQDPLLDLVHLVYPCGNILQAGPYNRLHGQRLLKAYRQNEQLKGRIMLVDDDLLDYLMLDPSDRSRDSETSGVLRDLAAEYAANAKGSAPGPLMQQESLFDRLWNKNAVMKHKITQKMLMSMRDSVVMSGTPLICYCQDVIPNDMSAKSLVLCSHVDCRFLLFHKACVKDMGVDKVSRWYCAECHGKMQLLAYKTLRHLGFDHVPNDDTVTHHTARMTALQEEYCLTEGAMKEIYAKLKTIPRGREFIQAIERKAAQVLAKKENKK